MVEAYWNIGKSIIEEQGGNEKAEYGTGLLKELSKQMTQDYRCQFEKYATVLFDISRWLRIAYRIELDALSASDASRE